MKLNEETVYYKNHYKKFKNIIIESINNNQFNVIIKFDIQNFYDNLDINILLNKIKDTIKFSTKLEKNFDEFQIKSISEFYSYLMAGQVGIPQGDNDVASAFLSNSYMKYIALDIIDIINKNKINDLVQFRIFQYSDDMYLAFKFNNYNDNKRIINHFIKVNMHKIAFKVQEKYKLKFNTKTKIYTLYNKEDIEEFSKTLKNISYIDPDLDEDERPNEVFENILNKLENYNQIEMEELETEQQKKDVLNKTFDYKIQQILRKKDNKVRLEKVLLKFNFNNVYILQNVITALSSRFVPIKERLLDYLENTNEFLLKDFFFAIEYICKIDYGYRKKYAKKNLPENYKKVLNNNEMDYLKIGYLNLNYEEWLRIKDAPNIIEQAKNRVIVEKQKSYNFALNYLTNEIRSICYYLDKSQRSEKEYKVKNIQEFLKTNKIEINEIIKVTNLFDRRNNNTVSHTNGRPINEEEYERYKKDVRIILKKIIKSI